MKITVLGGASFLGNRIVKELKNSNSSNVFQLIDAPRDDLILIKRYRDSFISLSELTGNDLDIFSPSLIIINLYDLLSHGSLAYSVKNNNTLINSINIVMEYTQESKSEIILIMNNSIYVERNLISKEVESYHHTYNTYNSFYYRYINVFSKIYSISMKVMLLPNVFGKNEPKEAVVSSVINSICRGETIRLSTSERKMLYIDQVIPEMIKFIFNDLNKKVIVFVPSTTVKVVEIYNVISASLNQYSKKEIFKENTFIGDMKEVEDKYIFRVKNNFKDDINLYLSSINK